MTAITEPSTTALQQAASWYAQLRDGQADAEQESQWRQWLNADESHRLAWQQVQIISRRFEPLQATPEPSRTAGKLQEANARLVHRRHLLLGIGALTGTGLLSWLSTGRFGTTNILPAWRADHVSQVGEQQELTLADGSRVWLNTDSAINVRLTATERRIHLLSGEVFIDTAPDLRRPLLVQTQQGVLQALGTKFNVWERAQGIHLAVFEGAVRINSQGAQQQVIAAGNQVQFNSQEIGQVLPANPAQEAWTRGILIAEDITLQELVAQLRRYHRGYIWLSEDVAKLKVYGSFPTQDVGRVLHMLEDALPVKVTRTMPWWINIEPL